MPSATSLVVYQWRNRWAVPVSAEGGTGLACRAFRAEVVDDPLRDRRGIPCAPVGAFHLRGFVGVFHVAELDEYCGVLRQIEAGEVSATIESVRPDVGGRAADPTRPVHRASSSLTVSPGLPERR